MSGASGSMREMKASIAIESDDRDRGRDRDRRRDRVTRFRRQVGSKSSQVKLEAAFTYRPVNKKSNVECCMVKVELLNC